MAQPTTARPGKMRILLGDGATPEVFSAPCGLTTKGLTIGKGLSEVRIPDCDDPDAPAWIGRDVTDLSIEISGEGLLAAESVARWIAAAYATVPTNAKVEIEFSTGTQTFFGAFHVDNFSINSQAGERVSASFSAKSDGEIVASFA
ncbi:MAG: hypothetical protein KA745_00215 [Gemmatimonadales bacterium]|nr:hypothetical protein [Gemmatimonadales bacterium]